MSVLKRPLYSFVSLSIVLSSVNCKGLEKEGHLCQEVGSEVDVERMFRVSKQGT